MPPRSSATTNKSEFRPLVHAIGGSTGTALALLLLYPLERARIEMQSQVAQQQQHQPQQSNDNDKETTEGESPRNQNDDHNKVSDDEESWSDAIQSSHYESSGDEKDPTSPSSPPSPVGHHQQQHQQQQSTWRILSCLRRLYDQGELYKGAGSIAGTMAVSNFIFFYLHHALASTLGPASTIVAGILNVLLTNPLWVVNLRLVTGQAHGETILGELRHLVASGQTQQLWHGTSSSLWLVSNPVLQWAVYQQLKQYLTSRHQQTLSPGAAFGAGALSKAVATLVTYPLQLAQSVRRLSNDNDDDEHNSSTWQVLRQLYRCPPGGIQAWYTGLSAKLWQTVLTAAFTFLTYEQILHAVQTVLSRTRSRRATNGPRTPRLHHS